MKKVISLLLSLLIVITMLPFPAKAADAQRYGYSLLTTDAQRSVYSEIAEGVRTLKANIPLSVSVSEATYQAVTEEIVKAISMVIKDYPEFFWFTGGYQLSGSVSQTGGELSVKPQYRLNGQEVTAGSAALVQAQEQMRQAVDAAKATIPVNASDYDIALALHDYLVENVQYMSVGDHQSAYGALVSGKAVCAGYARAYQLLMNEAGISCTYITGQSYDPSSLAAGDAQLQPHAWNLVWLDGKCYYTDVTWDDQAENGLFHEYLNLSGDEIALTHFPYNTEVLPGSCGHDDYRFFVKNSGKGICDIQDHKEDADVAQCFELKSVDGRNVVYYCTIHYHKDDFDLWFYEHYAAIGEKLGLETFDCDLVQLGHEHHVIYTGVLSESAPVPSLPETEPTEPMQTQPATQAPTTQPTQAPTQSSAATEPSVRQTEPVGTSDSTGPTETAGPTPPISPTGSTDPTEATSPTDPTQPAEPTEPTQLPSEPEGSSQSPQPTDTVGSEESLTQTQASFGASSEPDTNGPTESSSKPTEAPAEPDNTVTAVIVAVIVLLGAAAGGVSYYVFNKKKS